MSTKRSPASTHSGLEERDSLHRIGENQEPVILAIVFKLKRDIQLVFLAFYKLDHKLRHTTRCSANRLQGSAQVGRGGKIQWGREGYPLIVSKNASFCIPLRAQIIPLRLRKNHSAANRARARSAGHSGPHKDTARDSSTNLFRGINFCSPSSQPLSG